MRANHPGAVHTRAADDEQLTVPAPAGVSVATFAGFDPDGRFRVRLGAGADTVLALSTVGLTAEDVGTQVAVAYEGDTGRVIIIGRVQERALPAPSAATVDGERVVIRAERDLELRCGDASIVLTRAGKVLIKGNFVLTRSRGANKIKGAYVDIN